MRRLVRPEERRPTTSVMAPGRTIRAVTGLRESRSTPEYSSHDEYSARRQILGSSTT
jgi:hypothetical protein